MTFREYGGWLQVIFAHVPQALLDVHRRKQLVLRELIHCNADILCLQAHLPCLMCLSFVCMLSPFSSSTPAA